MAHVRPVLVRLTVVVVALGLLAPSGPAQGQVGVRERPASRAESLRDNPPGDPAAAHEAAATVVVGRVLGPDGLPAEGAVVVTSAGGQAVTDTVGEFRLEVELPAGVESAQVTAVLGAGTGTLIGSAQVGGLVPWGATSAGTIILEQRATCQPSWLPTFGHVPGVDSPVWALTVFDDGSGPALYAGGDFDTAGGVAANHIAKWNGTGWSELGSGTNSPVSALTVFDDGGGPGLYAGGYFTTAGGVPANSIARWNGSSWSSLGSGMTGGSGYGTGVLALAAFDDGSGPALYAGGDFTAAGGVAANSIAKWDGANWSALGSGLASIYGGYVRALTAFDDGSGPALYAGGYFTTAGGVPANSIAKWNGTSWSALGSGLASIYGGDVRALTVFDDGSGPALYAGGYLITAGGVPANSIAKWNGTSWSVLGSGIDSFSEVDALTVFDDGSGPALFAGGYFDTAGGVVAYSIAKWDGSVWSALGSGVGNYSVYALRVYDDGSGPALYAGGYFITAGGLLANDIAKWNGTSWSALGSWMSGYVGALTAFDDGSGPALYAGGYFSIAGGVMANGIAKWDGTSWSALGSGMGGDYPFVYALTVFDDGSGPALYAGGDFITAGGVTANSIAKWDGARWSALGSGTSNRVNALTVFDDGSGPALYAGGDFITAGGVTANSIAKWDGASWSALGSGTSNVVNALTVFDDGSGPALYAGGYFTTAGGVAANSIAKWNGSIWSALGSGMNYAVGALMTFDDGSGPALYAGGGFTTAGGVAANSIAKWNGATWSPLGSGMGGGTFPQVLALSVFDDGSGTALYAGGSFTTAGGVPANSIAKWNGTIWSPLGSGMNSYVEALTVFDDGDGPALYAGGTFTSAIDSGDSHLAKWGGCSATVSPWTSLGSALPGVSGAPLLEATGSMEAGSQNVLDLSNAAPSAVAILFAAPSSLPTPFKGGIVLPDPIYPPTYGMTSASGTIRFRFILPAGLPSGSQAWIQWGINDAAAVKGVSLSNAVEGVTP